MPSLAHLTGDEKRASFRRCATVRLVGFLLLWSFLAGCGGPSVEWNGDRVTAVGEVYGGDHWRLELTGFHDKLQPGEELDWRVNYLLELDDPAAMRDKIESVVVALAARRVCDAQGRFRDQDGYFSSTYLTPSGLPVDGFQLHIANSAIGGPYRTPLDHLVTVSRDEMRTTSEGLALSVPVRVRLRDDFPPGLYRFELAFYAAVDGLWYQLPALPAVEKGVEYCDRNFEDVFFQKILLPPVGVGSFAQPRMIWTLFTDLNSNGMCGVVAREDAPHFAMSNRIKLQGKYILPCTPDRGVCEYRLEPNLPTVDRRALFMTKTYDYQLLELDWSRGRLSVSVTRPDGAVDDLGTHRFRMKTVYGPRTFSGALKYRFDQFGKYEIRLTGEAFDYYGRRYEAGGTYEVWVAYPLSFATGVKPGNPMRVGGFYSPAATINPPVPAEVTATIRFFPGTHPQDVLEEVYTGRAQRFGYYFPDKSKPMLRFPEQGEYLFEFFAVYRDPRGRVFMGNMKNASVVLADPPSLIVEGLTNPLPEPIPQIVYSLQGGYHNSLPIQFPPHSGEMVYFDGNSRLDQLFNPAMGVRESTGALQSILARHFPPGLMRLNSKSGLEFAFGLSPVAFPGSQESIRHFAQNRDDDTSLLMSTTTEGFSPFEYPESVDRRGYYYIATSRPGFPVYFVVADSTIYENYWYTGRGNYGQTVGAGSRGDQPGDVYWSLVTALFADHEAKQEFYGQYASGGVGRPVGLDPLFYGPPFAQPVTTINGVDLYLYGGVGPSPGTIYETGAVKGVGSIAVPMAPHEAEINVLKPDGTVHACRGRTDFIGNFVCPSGPLIFDHPGVYRVFTKFWEQDKAGTCVGAKDGWYMVYGVEKDSPYRVRFDPSLQGRRVAYDEPLVIAGKVEPPLHDARAYYSIVTPGILMDEGELPVAQNAFGLTFTPSQFGAQFPNLFEHPGLFNDKPPLVRREDWRAFFGNLLTGVTDKRLSDTVEITVFIEGTDERGERRSAGGKLILRGATVMLPELFVADAGEERHE